MKAMRCGNLVYIDLPLAARALIAPRSHNNNCAINSLECSLPIYM